MPIYRRLICFEAGLRPANGCEVFCTAAGPISIGYKEPAGYYFHLALLRQQGLYEDTSADVEETEAAAGSKDDVSGATPTSPLEDQPPPGVSWKGTKKKKKTKKKDDLDLYLLLGLQHERWTATEAQIKNAYRKVCLEHHPDKKLAGVTDGEEKKKVEDYFKQIQEAYAVLSDPAKRREYDSVDEFDDSLPTECAPADFFKVFGPAFRRNSRWSVDQNVPDVGDEQTAWEDVDKFYSFWFTFKSWREFPHPDEEDVEGAESREHRRWIERNNTKLREKGKKEEGKRLREFVESAYKIDPRVQRKKEEERMERERKKAEKEEARRRAAEEEERKKAEGEAARKAAEEAERAAAKEAKAAREAAKKALKRERQKLRAICDGDSAGGDRLISEDDLEKITTRLDLEGLQRLVESLSPIGISRDAQREVLMQQVVALEHADEAEARAKEQQRKEAEAALKDIARREHQKKLETMREWDDEELRLLDKAVNKFPMGTPKRWEQVAAYVRTRTLEEVLLMVKERQGMGAARMKAQEDFKAAQKKRAEVTSQADLRCQAFTDVNVNLSGPAVASTIPAPTTAPIPNGTHSATEAAAAASASSAAPAAVAAAWSAAGKASPAQAAPAATPAAAAAAAAAGGAKKVVSSESGEWNEKQELALVKAMKQFGKELPDRWERVAQVVPGKTKAQCFKRFKELREVFRAKKGGDD